MKSKELRIGNLIGWHDGNREDFLPIEIQGIVGKRIHVNVNGSNQFCHESYQSFLPIPLTEEWLLKFGFEKHNNLFFSNHDYFSYIELGAYGCDGLYGYCLNDEKSIYHKLKYVHQLQNLYFALTNEELTLKS